MAAFIIWIIIGSLCVRWAESTWNPHNNITTEVSGFVLFITAFILTLVWPVVLCAVLIHKTRRSRKLDNLFRKFVNALWGVK